MCKLVPQKKKELSPPLKNWKVKPELLRQINIECAKKDITQHELAEKAWKAYKDSFKAARDALAHHHVAPITAAGMNGDPDFLHWVLDKIRERHPHVAAIEYNLMLLAVGLFAADTHPVEDLRGVLQLLYEKENADSSNGVDDDNGDPPKKRKSHVG